MFFDANAARRPKARSDGVATSMLVFNLPEGLLKASRVVAGVKSDKMSSARRCRVGDREGVRVCSVGAAILGRAGERTGVSPMLVAVG